MSSILSHPHFFAPEPSPELVATCWRAPLRDNAGDLTSRTVVECLSCFEACTVSNLQDENVSPACKGCKSTCMQWHAKSFVSIHSYSRLLVNPFCVRWLINACGKVFPAWYRWYFPHIFQVYSFSIFLGGVTIHRLLFEFPNKPELFSSRPWFTCWTRSTELLRIRILQKEWSQTRA